MSMKMKKRLLTVDDAEKICLDYLAVHDDLRKLLEEESRLMRQGQLSSGHVLPESKARLIDAYEKNCQLIVKHLDDVKLLVPKMVEKIIQRQQDLEVDLNNHQRVISSLHETALDLIRRVAEKAGKAKKPKLYAPYGTRNKVNERAVSVMVNVTY